MKVEREMERGISWGIQEQREESSPGVGVGLGDLSGVPCLGCVLVLKAVDFLRRGGDRFCGQWDLWWLNLCSHVGSLVDKLS